MPRLAAQRGSLRNRGDVHRTLRELSKVHDTKPRERRKCLLQGVAVLLAFCCAAALVLRQHSEPLQTPKTPKPLLPLSVETLAVQTEKAASVQDTLSRMNSVRAVEEAKEVTGFEAEKAMTVNPGGDKVEALEGLSLEGEGEKQHFVSDSPRCAGGGTSPGTEVDSIYDVCMSPLVGTGGERDMIDFDRYRGSVILLVNVASK